MKQKLKEYQEAEVQFIELNYGDIVSSSVGSEQSNIENPDPEEEMDINANGFDN